MTLLISDTFSGTGDVNGRTPDTAGHSGLLWASDADYLAVAGGYLEFGTALSGGAVGDVRLATYGDNTLRGGHSEITIPFTFRTGSSLSHPGVDMVIFSASIDYDGGVSVVEFSVLELVGGGGFNIKVSGLTSNEAAVTLATDTEYSGTLYSSSTEQSITLGVDVAVTNDVYDPLPYGHEMFTIGLGYGQKLNAISLSEADPETATASITMPIMAISGYSGATAYITLPMLTMYGTAHDSTGENGADITLPMFTLEAQGGANADIALPAFTVAATATVTALATASIALPAMTAAGSATVSAMAKSSPFLEMPMFEMVGYGGAVCSVTIGGMTVEATGTTGGVASAAITLPLFELEAEATAQNYGSAHITMPALVASNTARAFIVMPGFTLTAIGTAVVTATYEAYALNLNHSAEGPDELTRYTNYPFTHIVRYKNSYYGANSTGLYLLEGTTDNGTAIAFDVKTHKTDFGTAQKKSIIDAFIGGRMGASATITLHVGETSSEAYSYTTPRGSTAQNYRQQFGKGIKNRYYAFEIAGSGALSVDTITFNIATLARKV